MSGQQQKPRKIVKVGTHGHTSNSYRHNGQPAQYEPAQPHVVTRFEKDPAEWKARKLRKQARKDAARAAAKSQGLKLGRWRMNVALVKGGERFKIIGQKLCATVGSPQLETRFPGYVVLEGGAK